MEDSPYLNLPSKLTQRLVDSEPELGMAVPYPGELVEVNRKRALSMADGDRFDSAAPSDADAMSEYSTGNPTVSACNANGFSKLTKMLRYICIGLVVIGLFVLLALMLWVPWWTQNWKAVTAVMVTVLAILLMIDGQPSEVVLFLADMLLFSLGIIDEQDALKGFSSEGVLTVGVLFMVASSVHNTGCLSIVMSRILGSPKSTFMAQLRFLTPAILISGFLNDSPVVAMMVPIADQWSERIGIAKSKLLLPLSYAAMLGGVCTLIGSSTNITAISIARETDEDLSMSMFDLAPTGYLICLVGLVYMLIVSPFILPDNKKEILSLRKTRSYMMMFRIEDYSEICSQSLQSSGLRGLSGASLLRYFRADGSEVEIFDGLVLQAGDLLLFRCITSGVRDLRKIRGVVPSTSQLKKLGPRRRHRLLIEVVLSQHCDLLGRNARECNFRGRFSAVVLGVLENNLSADLVDIGDHRFVAGDTLLLEAFDTFPEQYSMSRTFALISTVGDSAPPRVNEVKDKARMVFAIVILVVMITCSAKTKIPLLVWATFAAILLIMTQCSTVEQAIGSIKWTILITIASSFGLGAAMQNTGVASYVAKTIVEVFKHLGIPGLMAGVYIATVVLGTVISNNATVVLLFPVVFEMAREYGDGLTYKPLMYVLIYAASASFATPISYQTNLMVYGPGGYRFLDYVFMGVPMQVVLMLVTVASVWTLREYTSLVPQ